MKNHNGSADRNNSTVPLQLEHIEAIEKRLWNAADTLRSNSNYASNNEKVSNGNYLWISYFYSYLNETGRAGFVMSSQASSAGRDEAKVRRKLIETGDVDIMIAIRAKCERGCFVSGQPTCTP
jgi:type I restriction-modification system DNA methylase subunit